VVRHYIITLFERSGLREPVICGVLLAAAVLFAGCGEGATSSDSTSAAQPGSARPLQELPGAAGPGEIVPPVSGPPRDSAHAVEIAHRVVHEPKSRLTLRVAMFTSADGGFLIKLVADPPAVGGGGLVWVEADGSVLVLRRYR
jgi:hypothetical protein